MRGVGWVDEIRIEHQVIDRTRQAQAVVGAMPPEDAECSLQIVERLGGLLICQHCAQGLCRGIIQGLIQRKDQCPACFGRDGNLERLRGGGLLLSRWLRPVEQAKRHGLQFRLFLFDRLAFRLRYLFRCDLKQRRVKGQRETMGCARRSRSGLSLPARGRG